MNALNALEVIGCAAGGSVVGIVTGFWLGVREGGDFNFAPVIYGPVGGLIGGFIGVVIGAVMFA